MTPPAATLIVDTDLDTDPVAVWQIDFSINYFQRICQYIPFLQHIVCII